ncbi:MAG: transposase [bacterium]
MARIARVVVPGIPHHVLQRGNRRQPVFFTDQDYRFYLYLLHKETKKANVEIWAYCLMPNHVHLVLVPSDTDGLRMALAETHRQYTKEINRREEWSGYLWQGRFQSFPMDEAYLLRAVRYIELNPVRAGMTATPDSYPWSSARVHLGRLKNDLINIEPIVSLVDDYAGYLADGIDDKVFEHLERHLSTGRPLGDTTFLVRVEEITGRSLLKHKPGPKRR